MHVYVYVYVYLQAHLYVRVWLKCVYMSVGPVHYYTKEAPVKAFAFFFVVKGHTLRFHSFVVCGGISLDEETSCLNIIFIFVIVLVYVDIKQDIKDNKRCVC